ncbi:hypothetical protein FC70_GL000379 [Paucilactobacillus oligofermentans DSM 15707 = LMG 22743]|uniref:Threonylcarbamoyl-AMP synthase n=1 Tax=Paucilactobacillus oligofermentans DSM 15707 = LMG 22743 TaxID=1423778 RepID=A0A0R1RUL7_9LACO|nr:L-threonylcarbamoyladenylate synthase [Paucilactobacillus oligofermentans]KRL57906.1 hypothetical protein FC70_GL000379 [Paucilactobacillus oligofermentans DSM 15707 = LMG 22743]CUS26623.1 Probable tRNA threonylcarbamoyladenosine biosynthesis protein YwlC [Paucilactobacillus oligofermentans DSM 15707 = LMG 22743]
MKTQIFTIKEIKQAAQLISDGQLVAFPTETVYGLGADATNEAAVKQVYLAKGRPSDNPLIVHVADIETVEKYAKVIPDSAYQLMNHFWPGSLTMIFTLKDGVLSKSVTGGLNTAAFRFPDNDATRKLIELANCPIVGPSANTSGKPSPTKAQHVYHDLNGKIAGILDDGETKVGVESTVIDMSTDTPVILRPGAVTKSQIESVIGSISNNHHQVGDKEVPKAPGMKYTHYSPKAQVTIYDPKVDLSRLNQWLDQQKQPIGLMIADDQLMQMKLNSNVEVFSLGKSLIDASHQLFAGLRYFDDQPEVNTIMVQSFEANDLGLAYMNRLEKSAGGSHF